MKLKNITIQRSGQNYGPYPEKRVIDFLDQGLILETDLAWYPGITGWVSLREALSLDPLTTGEQNVDSDKHVLLDEVQDAQAFELFEKIKELLKFCDIEFEQNCIEFYNNKRPIKTVSINQARQPIYKSSVNNYQNFEKF